MVRVAGSNKHTKLFLQKKLLSSDPRFWLGTRQVKRKLTKIFLTKFYQELKFCHFHAPGLFQLYEALIETTNNTQLEWWQYRHTKVCCTCNNYADQSMSLLWNCLCSSCRNKLKRSFFKLKKTFLSIQKKSSVSWWSKFVIKSLKAFKAS